MCYNTQPLLATIDSLIVSAKQRLTTEELLLLEDIKTSIRQAEQDEIIEAHFFRLIEFILLIQEYVDKFL